ncbi:hypothetical protein KIS4809_4635 [Bacillus sp. ZZV12-4809]|nr:hypothetical protein KIS4809_4635 [Bacillus sp. ZZV12-4809]
MNNVLGTRLKYIRKSHRMTMEKVGESLGIAKSSYAGYESGERKPPPDKLVKLASMFDVSCDYLLGITDDPVPKRDNRNLSDFLKRSGLHYDGVKLTAEEIRVIRDMLSLIARGANK